ncbi:hypothetical protein DBIPINDM_005811 [Mesorhizobium sp. AR02]|uniref:hypothetical protein n=1 Tax=Mesorhizobium sp. AR02 TaxID=2865837 RepID=UPI00215F893E|nr:hypothetical protein [Mesorhizobium sp. AR02]UVK52437.1 hypothetical protein DBIPINDM_005811 [Mesorhizobium sp. AR02]
MGYSDLDEEIQISNLEMEVRYHLDIVAEFQRRTIDDDLALFGYQDTSYPPCAANWRGMVSRNSDWTISLQRR